MSTFYIGLPPGGSSSFPLTQSLHLVQTTLINSLVVLVFYSSLRFVDQAPTPDADFNSSLYANVSHDNTMVSLSLTQQVISLKFSHTNYLY